MEVPGKKSHLDVSCHGSNEDDEDFYCYPCENEGEWQPAKGFCVDCQEYLCSSCFTIHRRPSVWRHHVLLDKDAMPKTKTKEQLNFECTEPCIEHSTKIIEYYCQTHHQLGCPVCITGNHRTCNDVDYIPHIAERYKESSEINEIFVSLESLQDETDAHTATANNNKLKVVVYEKNAKAQVLQLRDEFNSICDRLLEDIDTVKSSDESKLKNSIAKYEEISKKIKTRTAVMEKKRSEMKVSQLFTEAKLSKMSAKELAKEVTLARENAAIRHYEMTFNLEELRDGLKLNFHDNQIENVISQLECHSPSDYQNKLARNSTRHEATVEDHESNKSANAAGQSKKSNKRNITASNMEGKVERESPPDLHHSDVWSPLNTEGRKTYGREFLLQFRNCAYALRKPKHLPDIPDIILDKLNEDSSNGDPSDFKPKYAWSAPSAKKHLSKSKVLSSGSHDALLSPSSEPDSDPSDVSQNVSQQTQSSERDFVLSSPSTPTIGTREESPSDVLQPQLQGQVMSLRPPPGVGAEFNDLIVKNEEDNEAVIEWIDSNVDVSARKQPQFIRALTTVICNSAIKGNKGQEKFEPMEIITRSDLLKRYINEDIDLELQAMYAVQALVSQLGHPNGVLRALFDTLYDEDLIAEDTLWQWQRSKDEPDGKEECLKQTVQFFTWLKEAEDDDFTVINGVIFMKEAEDGLFADVDSNIKNCKDVHSIPDEIDTLFQKSDVVKTNKELLEMKTMISERMKLRQKLLEELTKSKIEAIRAIKDFKADMMSILERLENETLKEVENEFRKLESTLKEEMKKAENELKCLEQTADYLQKSEGNNAQQFVSMKNVAKSLSHAEEISRLFDKSTNAKITFVFNTDIQDVLEKLKTFGSVKNSPSSNVKRATIYTIKANRDIKIKLQSDNSTSNVHGSCITEDGMLMLADCANSKLKRANIRNMSVVDHCVLPAPPYSVCCTSHHEAAVILNNNSIQFVSLRNLMTPTRQINLNHYCYGIAYKDDKLYITDADRALYMHDVTGNLLRKVLTDSLGRELFQTIQHVSISEYEDRVYVGDWNKGLITLDAQGTHVGTFKDKGLSNASGVCIDSRGNVFVCGCGSHNVMQITEDGHIKKGVVVQQSDGVHSPASICFDRCRCALVVTQFNNDIVKVLELQ